MIESDAVLRWLSSWKTERFLQETPLTLKLNKKPFSISFSILKCLNSKLNMTQTIYFSSRNHLFFIQKSNSESNGLQLCFALFISTKFWHLVFCHICRFFSILTSGVLWLLSQLWARSNDSLSVLFGLHGSSTSLILLMLSTWVFSAWSPSHFVVWERSWCFRSWN